MKPNSILQNVQQRFRVVANWTNNPVANAMRVGRRRFETWWQSLEMSGDTRQPDSQRDSQRRQTQIPEPRSEVGEKLNFDRVNFDRDFEEIRQGRKIQINETRYEFKESIYRKPERYITDDSRYCIQEISNPPLTSEELTALRSAIKNKTDKALDFRVVLPVDLGFETIRGFDEQNNRLYCISPNNLVKPLNLDDSISSRRVYHILQDVLQSLEYLHIECQLLPNSLGIAHGDVKLENLAEDKGKIYLRNLKLFDFQFRVEEFTKPSAKEKDLQNLGFYVDRYIIDGNRNLIADRLQKFVNDLQNGQYKKVDRAIHELNRIQSSEGNLFREPSTTEPSQGKPNRPNYRAFVRKIQKYLILVILGFLLFFLLGFLKSKLFPPEPLQLSTQNCVEAENCQIKTVFEKNPNIVPTLTYYSGEIWRKTWEVEKQFQHRSTLEQIFKDRGMKFELKFETNPTRSQIEIGPKIELTPSDWQQEAIAYDGFVVFVSNQETDEGQRLANLLKGQISLSDLRQIYNSNLRYWSDIDGVRNFQTITKEIQVYFADEENELEEQFAKILYPDLNESLRWEIPKSSTIMETIEAVANPNNYAIGVARLGKVFEQCSVYPLAIVSENGDVIQPFIDASERPIDSTTDLCMDKGSYFPDREQFASERYPLGYQWVVAYPEGENTENARGFIEMLKTQEGQSLLQEVGLIPLPPSKR